MNSFAAHLRAEHLHQPRRRPHRALGPEVDDLDAEIRRQFLRRGVDGRRNQPVNVMRAKPRIGDGLAARIQHHLDCGNLGALHIVGFANADDGRLFAEIQCLTHIAFSPCCCGRQALASALQTIIIKHAAQAAKKKRFP